MSVSAVLSGEKRWHVEQTDVLTGLRMLPNGCIHCAVTSPPYYGLRSYLPSGHADKAHEIGIEKTPAAYLDRMVEVFREVRRTLHDTGVLWLNIGDSYAASGAVGSTNRKQGTSVGTHGKPDHRWSRQGYQPGDLLGIPHWLAQAMQADGWILRADIVWVKAAPMPESVQGWFWQMCRVKVRQGNQTGSGKQAANRLTTGLNERTKKQRFGHSEQVNGKFVPKAKWHLCPGCPRCEKTDGLVLRKGSWRPTRAHEHIFLFAKSPLYFADGEAVRTKLEEATKMRDTYSRILDDADEQFAVKHDHETPSNPAGANLRDWWMLKKQDLDEAHYAAFPPSLPAICIQAGTSERGVCGACGMPWARIIEKSFVGSFHAHRQDGVQYGRRHPGAGPGPEWETPKALGWRPTCSCNAGEPIPALVLDPFVGSGTSGIVARRLGRRFLGMDLSAEYVEMARRRITGDQPLFNSQGGAS